MSETPSPPPRSTPAKFNRPHVVARFSFRGHLVTVLPQFLASDRPRPVEISEPDVSETEVEGDIQTITVVVIG